MKYIIVVGDGMADWGIEAFGGKTPLEYARTPYIDYLAARSELGMANMVPEELPPASDIGNMSILGADPIVYQCGRGAIEALANPAIVLRNNDSVYRCNFVCINDNNMVDYSGGGITSEQANILINDLNMYFKDSFTFYAGVDYRNLLIYPDGPLEGIITMPPHNISGKPIQEFLPTGPHAEKLIDIINRARQFLSSHTLVQEQSKKNTSFANALWLWGHGGRPHFPNFKEQFNLRGAVITAVDIVRGLAVGMGFDIIPVDGATGRVDTNYEGKAAAALKAQKEYDFIFIHVEATDESGHAGDAEEKVRGIENLDQRLIRPLIEGLGDTDFRFLFLPDHPTPCAIGKHTNELVPYLLFDSRSSGCIAERRYTEATGRASGVVFNKGHLLIRHLLEQE